MVGPAWQLAGMATGVEAESFHHDLQVKVEGLGVCEFSIFRFKFHP